MDRLAKIQEVSGGSVEGFEGFDLSTNFDPEAHDAAMETMFNDDFYEADEALAEDEFKSFIYDGDERHFDKPLRFQKEQEAKMKKANKKAKRAADTAEDKRDGGGFDDELASLKPQNAAQAAMLAEAMDE